jgi:hypothetical protein
MSSSNYFIMVAPPQNKKRDRSPSPMPSYYKADNATDEYERAVAFLHEFHSRRVAALHSTSLDTLDVISEEFDDLADDFSLALNVSSSRQSRTVDSCDYVPQRKIIRSPKMKKTVTSTCLADLDNSSADEAESASSSTFSCPACRPKMSTSCLRKYDVDADHNFVYCISRSPMHKRQRGRLGSVA